MGSKIFFLCFIISFATFCNAQILNSGGAQTQDSELWTGVNLTKKINKRIGVNFDQNIRFNNNFSKRKSTFTEVGLTYRFKFPLRINTQLRYILDSNNESSLRPVVNLNYRLLKLDDFRVSYRFRWQKDFEDFQNYEFDFDQTIRSRISFSYKIKDLTPSIEAEFFNELDNAGSTFNELRIGLGLDIKINKRHDLSIGYTFREETNVRAPLQSNIFAIKWNFEIKNFKKKDKDEKEEKAKDENKK